MIGTITNTITVIVGGFIGFLIGKRFPGNMQKAIFSVLGLFTIMLGSSMAQKSENMIIMVLSLILGTIFGELLKIEKFAEKISNKLKTLIKNKNKNFSDGLITGFMLFCMGSLTILGAIQEGIQGKADLLLTKAVMDGFASLVLASGFGIGVVFSAIPLFLYQGFLTLLAKMFGSYIPIGIVGELSAIGGVIIMGIGFNLMKIKKIRLLNMFPSFIIVSVLVYYFG